MRNRKMMMLLCTLMLVLSACSNGGSKGGPSTAAVTETKPETAATDTENKGAEKESEQSYKTPDMDFDLGGRTIKVVSWWDMTIPEDNPDNIQRKKTWRSCKRSIISKWNTSRSTTANTSKK